jgi:phosphoenolpyruvate-protein kinase (PTS system EI component)
MHPAGLLEIKRVIQDSHVGELTKAVQRLLRTTDAEKYTELLKDIAQN